MRETVIGKYIRLSQADRDLMKKESKTESESISHQRALIQNYIDSDPELKKCRQEEFFDDGYSGTNFDRPSFERLLQKIRSGEINCVIVKDFSRFGRDYIELGDYLERIFPFLGVRFISVNDHYDSNDYKGTTGGLDVVMKNIVYDYYSKDLSMKLQAFVSGRLMDMTEVEDDMFSQKMMGDGVAIEPTSDTVVAPADAEVTMIMEESLHAVGLRLENGAELLIHIGIDTVKLQGQGFQVLTEQGAHVKAGTPLIRFDADVIRKAGYKNTVIMAVTNSADYMQMAKSRNQEVKAGETEILSF